MKEEAFTSKIEKYERYKLPLCKRSILFNLPGQMVVC